MLMMRGYDEAGHIRLYTGAVVHWQMRCTITIGDVGAGGRIGGSGRERGCDERGGGGRLGFAGPVRKMFELIKRTATTSRDEEKDQQRVEYGNTGIGRGGGRAPAMNAHQRNARLLCYERAYERASLSLMNARMNAQ